MGVYAICTHYEGSSARLIKRLLLDSFSFPLKRCRAGKFREVLDLTESFPADYAKDNLGIPWRECVSEAKELDSLAVKRS